MEKQICKFIPVTSLEKIFPDEAFIPKTILTEDTMLQGERYSFQAAYCLEEGNWILPAHIEVSGTLAEHVLVRQVGLAPSEMPCYPDCDDFVLRKTPGLYPDPLYPFDGNLKLIPGQWRSIWFTIPAECELPAGDYELTVNLIVDGEEAVVAGSFTFTMHRLTAALPKQKLLHTQWFHTDCIADWYQAPVFSDRYWELVKKYMKAAASYGINLILTPLFTPPLDTVVGGERTTVQLVDVWKDKNTYSFGFERLKQWIACAGECGIDYFELSHLFTQWGANHAPKIMAYEGKPGCACGEPVKIFGWETESTGDEYRSFLEAFLPKLMEFIHENRLEKNCYFHISDEPSREQLPSYLACRNLVKGLIGDMPIMDAISDYEYYEQGVIDLPVCSTNHLKPFLENQVPQLWAYYCCGQYKKVANRFFNMPSVRNRILGVQLYKYRIQGFLQWGFNFWNSQLSVHRIDPFRVTDAGLAFPSGDAFLVYPGEDGPIGCLRGEVFGEGLQDMRLLTLVEERFGREKAESLIDEGLKEALTFEEYPQEDAWLLQLRKKCHALLS